MTKDDLYWHIREILNALEAEIAKADAKDESGIITNHLAATWKARDKILEAFREPEPNDERRNP